MDYGGRNINYIGQGRFGVRQNAPERTMRTLRIPLRVVFYKEDGDWIAHCLEFDLVGDGDTKDAAWANLCDAIVTQVHHFVENPNPANLFSQAPGRYLAMFAAGEDTVVAEMSLHLDHVSLDDVEAREYTDPSEYSSSSSALVPCPTDR